MAPKETMTAALYHSTSGGLEKNLKHVADARRPPAPTGDQVLIHVLSAGINPVDFSE